MKYTSLLAASLLAANSLLAQNQEISQIGCGTITTDAEINRLEKNIASAKLASKEATNIDSVPLTIHIVTDDKGRKAQSIETLLKVITQVNAKNVNSGIFYYVVWPVRFIANDDFYIHNSSNGSQMMRSNNVRNTVNVYFVNDPNGACGYYSPAQDAVAIAYKCNSLNSTTLVHELGHFLSLPHTFYGWEYSNPPQNAELVRRDNLKNCHVAGDRFCDTDADYLAERWQCPYNGNKQDNNGYTYHPDSSLYMSYSTDQCMTRFSNEQIAAMRADLQDRQNLLTRNKSALKLVTSNVEILIPNKIVYNTNTTVRWTKATGADMYHVKLYGPISNTSIYEEKLTADTFFTINYAMKDGIKYRVQVVPLNGADLVGTYATWDTFTYQIAATGINDANQNDQIVMSPNPTQGENVQLQFASPYQNGLVKIYDIAGKCIKQQPINGESQITLQGNLFHKGIYIVTIDMDGRTYREKLIVQ